VRELLPPFLPPRFAVPAFPDMIELPPEVWYEILHYVPGHDILHLRLVSKYLDCMITQRILHHARQSKLRISLLDSFSFPKGVEIVSHPTYTSSSTKILLDESKVEYSFANNVEEAEYEISISTCACRFPFRVELWNDLFSDLSKWSFDFLQNAGSWSWTFDVFWKKGEKCYNDFSVFFSNVSTESATCPRGEALTCWPVKYQCCCKHRNHVVDDGVALWGTIKVPLKVLAHQFAGNLGEK
jgi:hypothetical protein